MKLKQVEQSSDHRCVLWRAGTSTGILLVLVLVHALSLPSFTLTLLKMAPFRDFNSLGTDGRTHPLIEMRERI